MAYVIGIGGVRAVAKSTISRTIGDAIRADVQSVGRVRDIIRPFYKVETNPEIYQSVTGAPNPQRAIELLNIQAVILRKPLIQVMSDCRKREASIILEGTHVVPGVYEKGDFDVQVVLRCSKERLEYRIKKDKKRANNPQILENQWEIQQYLEEQARKYNIPVIDSDSIPAATISIFRLFSEDKLPKTFFDS